ncbi:hypothetical protein GEMRC1_011544 [Eukaryota sp. GEM-RC1]
MFTSSLVNPEFLSKRSSSSKFNVYKTALSSFESLSSQALEQFQSRNFPLAFDLAQKCLTFASSKNFPDGKTVNIRLILVTSAIYTSSLSTQELQCHFSNLSRLLSFISANKPLYILYLQTLALFERQCNNINSAISCYKQAISVYSSTISTLHPPPASSLIFSLHKDLAMTHLLFSSSDHISSAAGHLLQCTEMSEPESELASIYLSLSYCFSSLSLFSKALRYIDKLLDIDSLSKEEKLSALVIQAKCLLYLNNHDDCLRVAETGIQLAEADGDYLKYLNFCNISGWIHLHNQNERQCLFFFKSVQHFEKCEIQNFELYSDEYFNIVNESLLGLSWLYFRSSEFLKSLNILNQFSMSNTSKQLLISFYKCKILNLFNLQHFEQAQEIALTATSLFKESEDTFLAFLYSILGCIYQCTNDTIAALNSFRKSIVLLRKSSDSNEKICW